MDTAFLSLVPFQQGPGFPLALHAILDICDCQISMKTICELLLLCWSEETWNEIDFYCQIS